MAAFLVVLVLALTQQATCRQTPSSPIRAAAGATQSSSRSLLAQQTDSVAAAPGLEVIEGQYVVLFKAEAGDASTAAGNLVNHVKTAMASSTPLRGVATAAAAAADSFQVVANLGASSAAARGAAAAVASAPRAATSMQGIVVRASAAAVVAHMRSASVVSAVFPDRIIAAQVQADQTCVEAQVLAAGIVATPSPNFKWPTCFAPGTRLVWIGQPCGGGSRVQFTELRAVDVATNSIKAAATGRACIVRANPTRTTWNKQKFGACGEAPLHAPVLPTMVCSPTGGNAKNVPATEPVTPSSSPSPVLEQPTPEQPWASPSPVTVDSVPSASPSPVPVPEIPVSNSPVLARVPLASGERVPSGVARIEAATAAGVVDTAVLPAAQQVVVAVVDSGVDGTHPDINLVGGSSWAANEGYDMDKYGHGTHVAGIIGARNNGQGVVGVSPGAPVFALKVLDSAGKGSLSSVIAAVSWVAGPEGQSKGIKVINLSLAAYVDPSSADYPATRDAVCGVFQEAANAGVVVIAAAGNYGANMRGYLPASCPTVAAVTAVNSKGDAAAEFSNWLPVGDAAPEELARVIAAPGSEVLSTVSYARDASGYKTLSGTSMAAPHVAAVAANCLMSGACAPGVNGLNQLAALQAAAKERLNLAGASPFGFRGDATSSINAKYMGLLTWAKF